ncbi:undecaprenyl-diphosphate phosphatase [Spiractinospora alimapuensis]|uniref:undecaprenyl-diphosphate phosphatase n=1 Tax=Spiractinospora alimapuensis TaxID=2820884 RepID=UPI001F308D84|nr:undecaprenyl-diphosphate phosphatase [Spiractinospora alimapuensis]QVQ52749.1 undecaprenyl-diphosphate phosphatase [Spiractinospora alimapuensis]
MSLFEAVILGLVQGLTEFLPISSSGHLRVVSALFGWPDPGAAFTAVSQIGTELAVVIYFRQRIWAIISTWTRSLVNRDLRGDINARMGWYVIIGTIPIVVLGLLLEDQIDSVFRDLRLVALNLIIFGVILGIADRFARKHRELEDLNVPRGLSFGLFQALALIPGVSRSGGTITGGMFLGFKRKDAAEYAFLLAIPAVFGSGLYKLTDIGENEYAGWAATIVGTLIAGVVGFVVIAWLMRFISTHSFMPFVYYRVGLGILILALVSWGALDPQGGAESQQSRSDVATAQEEPDEEPTPESSAESSPEPTPTPSADPSPSVDPVTGWEIDPEVGLPRNPDTGLYHDPNLGMDVDYDESTGLATNPVTGESYEPEPYQPQD